MLARFWFGLTLPLVLLRRLWREPVARRAWLWTVGTQALVTLGVGSAVFLGDAPEGRVEVLERLGLWVSTLVGVQSVVLALSRDFQDRLARDLALVAGLEPEDDPPRARLRVDWRWLLRKGRRRLRGLLTTAQGLAALLPLLALLWVLDVSEAWSAAVALVSAYWWVVFTAARSARAWLGEEDPTPGTPVGTTIEVYSRIPGLRWFATFSRWSTQAMAAPSRAVERDPAAFAGLAVFRVVASVPVVRLALRAALIVAAADLLERTGGERPCAQADSPEDGPAVNDPPAQR